MKKKRFDIEKFWKGRTQPASVKRKRSQRIKELWLSGKWRPWNAGKHLSKSHRLKLRKSNVLRYSDIRLRKKVGRNVKKAFSESNARKKIDIAVTRYYREHPQARKERAERVIRYFKSHPLAFKRFMDSGKNPLKRHIRTKAGFLVRSSGEQKIAGWLYEHGVHAEYESRTLFLDGYLCTPDFLIPRLNEFIEFYGGYPGSWKKKVIKNRLYKKCGINLISITPSELENLDKCLKAIRR